MTMGRLLAGGAIAAFMAMGAVPPEAKAGSDPGPDWQLVQAPPGDPPGAAEPPPADSPADLAETPAEMSEEVFVTEQQQTEWKSSNVVGATVYNLQDEAIGQITDLIIDEEGEVVAAVVGVGGFLGIGQKQVGILFDAIETRVEPDGEVRLVMDGTREALEEAPDYIDLAEQERQRQMDMPLEPPPGAPGTPGMPTN